MKTIAEIMQFCVLNGISVLCQKPVSEDEGFVAQVLPDGRTPSVIGRLRVQDTCEVVFTSRQEHGWPEWHIVVSTDLARDKDAFEDAFRNGFETFCRLAGISPRTPQTLWGRPLVEAENSSITDIRNFPQVGLPYVDPYLRLFHDEDEDS